MISAFLLAFSGLAHRYPHRPPLRPAPPRSLLSPRFPPATALRSRYRLDPVTTGIPRPEASAGAPRSGSKSRSVAAVCFSLLEAGGSWVAGVRNVGGSRRWCLGKHTDGGGASAGSVPATRGSNQVGRRSS